MSTSDAIFLITGFGPFPGAERNPGQLLVETVQQSPLPCLLPNGVTLACETLPTSWQRAVPSLEAAFRKYQPDMAVHFGYGAGSPGFQLESTAYNETCDLPDMEGTPGSRQPVCAHGPSRLTTTLPLQTLKTELTDKGFAATCSDDPGRYLCNLVYYRSLQHMGPHASLFIHIPALATGKTVYPPGHERDSLPLSTALEGLFVMIEVLARTRAGTVS